jgi:hypothetical protein
MAALAFSWSLAKGLWWLAEAWLWVQKQAIKQFKGGFIESD